MSATILGLVGFVLSNAIAIAGGIYVGHRYADKVEQVYDLVEGVVGYLYGLLSGRRG